ncbi:MAG: tetratricopeptide repeat protein, partial [Deltaproteobacteria bacterium]|nr:tetratricopeptide repeat protein [Deltaproteobacteria bacterium]
MKRLWFVFLILLLPFKNAQADLKSAYEALQSKNYEFALSQLSGVKSSSLQDYIFWIHGKSSLELGRLDDAIRAFEQLMTQDPRSLFVDDARAGLAKAWYQKSNFEKVRSLMMGSLSKFEDASKKEKGEALYYAGLAELQLGDSNKALAYLKESYLQNPNPEISKELSAKLSELGVQLNATDLLKRADQYFNSKSYSEAIRAYEAVVSGEEARVASVKKGEALYQLKKCSEALPYLTNTASGLSIELARLVLLHRGICQQKVQDTSQAQMTFERVQQLYPSTLEGEEALYRLGDMALNSGNATQAFSYFQSLSDQYPRGNFRDKGMWAAAWKAYETQDFDRAKKFLSSLENGAQDFPTKGKAIYWLGKVALKQKNEKLAKSE